MLILSTEKTIDSLGDLGKGEKLTVYTASWYQKSVTNIGKDNSQVVRRKKSQPFEFHRVSMAFNGFLLDVLRIH
jgi:hypothetical protein